ncbi:MAG: hypothetical protein KC561_06375 [Myxococcales bacterium]|nr:hypothetical protein [Myxococcales bacterium]
MGTAIVCVTAASLVSLGALATLRSTGRAYLVSGFVSIFLLIALTVSSLLRETTFLSEVQFAELEGALDHHKDLPIAVIALSVPLLHLPEWLGAVGAKLTAEGSDADDRWGTPRSSHQRDRLLELLHDWVNANPERQVVLVGGDVHVGLIVSIEWDDGTRIHSLASSAVSNLQPALIREVAERLPELPSEIDLDAGATIRGRIEANDTLPFGGLYAGFIHFERKNGGWKVDLEVAGVRASQPGQLDSLVRLNIRDPDA